MNIEQLIAASEAIAWLAQQANTPGEESEKRVVMALHLGVSQSYLLEYAAHVSRGAEPYDALLATARGELQFSQRQQDLLRTLMPPPTP